jgi:inhibitor of cysteine peptidase
MTAKARAVVYTLNEKTGFTLRGKVTHYSDEDILKMGDYWPYSYDKNIERILYIGDYLYTISQSMLKANDIKTVKDVKSIDID